MIHVLLARASKRAIEMCIIPIDDELHLPLAADVARREGYDLMFELRDNVAAEKVQRWVADGNAIAAMPEVKKLWDLSGPHKEGDNG